MKAKKGHGWTKLERIKMDCFWVNLKNVGPPFFKFTFIHVHVSVYTCIKMSFAQLEMCYVAIILQMKHSWSANLTFRGHD